MLNTHESKKFRNINSYEHDNAKVGSSLVPSPDEKRLYLAFVTLTIIILVLCLGTTMALFLNRERASLDNVIEKTAGSIAGLNSVTDMLITGYPDRGTITVLESIEKTYGEGGVIVVSNKDGLRFFQSDRELAGDLLEDGNEKDILSGSAPYIKTVYGTRGTQRSAFHGIYDYDGNIIGFVMVSIPKATITSRTFAIVQLYLILLFLFILISAIMSRAFILFQQNSLMGMRPTELLTLYFRQDDIINSLNEGIISTDKNGKILFSNQMARKLITGKEDIIAGKNIKDVWPLTKFDTVISTGEPSYNRSVETENYSIFVTEVPIRKGDKKPEGMLIAINDRSEVLAISDELSGARSMMETLRIVNHEFLNKLHVILGYIQTNQIDNARDFIINSSFVSSQSVRQCADAIRLSQVLALIIGKMMHAAEQGITLTLEPESSMREKEVLLSQNDYTTIIGNLLENSIEELTSGYHEVKEIRLGIYCRSGVNIITCEDTGNGIKEEILEKVLEKGISTKGENHGMGLWMINKIVTEKGGTLHIETEENEGTAITITFVEEKGDDHHV